MFRHRIIFLIGLTEILIGLITLLTVGASVVMGTNAKTTNIFIFVVVTAIFSLLLGMGILRFNRVAYSALIYFASVIVLSKLLIFAQIITVNGAIETVFPAVIKNGISVLYHAMVILYLNREETGKLFTN